MSNALLTFIMTKKCPSIILVKCQRIKELNISGLKKDYIISVAIGSNPIQDIKDMLNSEKYKEQLELFTSQTLAFANFSLSCYNSIS